MAATSDTTGFSHATPATPDTSSLTGATSSNSQGSLFSATTSGLQTLDVIITNILSDNKKIAFEPYNNQFTLSDGTTGYSALHYATRLEILGLDGLGDVNISNIADKQILSYDSSTSKFINAKLAFDNIDSNAVINSNTMVGASSTTLATSASIKAYVDAHPGDITGVTAGDGLTGGGDSGSLTLSAVGTSNRISVSGAGIDIDSNYVGQSSITTLGTITTGEWRGTNIADTYISSASTWNSKQAGHASLTSISGLTTSADKMIYTTGSNSYAVTALTATARTLLDDADTSTMRTTLGLAINSDVQAHDSDLDTLAGLSKADSNFIVGSGSAWVVESGTTVRTSLGLGATAVTGVDNSTIEIDSSNLQVKADGINNTHIDFGTTGNKVNTDNLTEGSTNLYHTTARARASVSATDNGGDGSFAYNSSTGVFTYTGPSASEVRAHLSAGTGLTYSSGEFSIDSTVVQKDATQTLTDKTLTTPIIASLKPSGSNTLTMPNTTDTIVGKATTDNLTNKTLTSAVLDVGVSGTAIKDEDNMDSNSASHLATQQSIKAYVDSVASGLDVKDSVVVATTADISSLTYNNGSSGVGATLTASGNGAVTIDGIALDALNMRVLVKDQDPKTENGIYYVSTVGTGSATLVLTRSTDADTNTKLTSGAFVFSEKGTDNSDKGFVMTQDNTITFGSTAIEWSQFSGAGQITAGAGLTKSGDTINVIGTANKITVNANDITIASTYAGQTSIDTLGTIGTGTWQGTAIANTYVADDLTISGGTINNSSVGATTPSTGAFTTLSTNDDVTFTGTSYNVVWDKSQNSLEFSDNARATFGTGNDLEIYHDSSHSYIDDVGSGSLIVKSNQLLVRNPGNQTMINASSGGAVELYNGGNKKFETTSTGATVTGTITTDGLTVDGNTQLTGTLTVGADDTGHDVIFYGADAGSHLQWDESSDELVFHDESQIRYKNASGTSALSLRHGTDNNTYLTNEIGSFNIFQSADDGAVRIYSDDGSGGHAVYFQATGSNGEALLYHYGSQRLATKSTGIDVTGTVTDDGATHDGDVTFTGNNYNVVWDKSDSALEFADGAELRFGAGNDLTIRHDTSGNNSRIIESGTGSLIIQAENLNMTSANSTEDYIRCVKDGSVSLYYDDVKKFETTSAGATVTGTLTATAFSGDLTGNADTATLLANARTIAGQSFNGGANITIASTDLSNTSDIVLKTATQTLTNKTLERPTMNTGTSGGFGDSVLIGYNAGSNAGSSHRYNVGIGYETFGQMGSFSTNNYNVALGYFALHDDGNSSQSSFNVAIGSEALKFVDGATNNIGIGYQALMAPNNSNHLTGDYNIAIGREAGEGIKTGSGNILIGHEANTSSNSANNELVIKAYDNSNAVTYLTGAAVGTLGTITIPGKLIVSTGETTLGNYVLDSDQTVGSSQDNHVLTYDHSTGKISLEASSGGGGSAAAGSLTGTTLASNVTASSLTSVGSSLTLTSTASGNGDGPTLTLKRDNTPTGSFFNQGHIEFLGENQSGTEIKYGEIKVQASTTSAGNEESRMVFKVMNDGADKEMMYLDAHQGGGVVYLTAGIDLLFEGPDSSKETTLTVETPTADRTITLPNATGTVLLKESGLAKFSDNEKVVFGTGSDMSMYWDGTDAHIDSAGDLNISNQTNITLSGSGSWQKPIQCLAPNVGNGGNAQFTFGTALSTYNLVEFSHHKVSSGNIGNYITIGYWGNQPRTAFRAGGEVSIGKAHSSPVFNQMLNVTGSAEIIGNIELGHINDTTISRSAAGTVQIEGNTILTTGNSDAPTITTSSGDADFVLVDDGGTMKKITPANLGIGGGGGSGMPTTGGTFTGDVTFNGDNYNTVWDKSESAFIFSNYARAVFGDPSASNPKYLEIEHNASANSIIKHNGSTGDLYIQNRAENKRVYIQADDQNYGGNPVTYIAAEGYSGEARLYHAAAGASTVKLATKSTGIEIQGVSGGTAGTITLNCPENSHGVKIQSPAHSAAQEYTLILPDNQIAADKILKVKSISGSGATAIGQLEFADASSGSGGVTVQDEGSALSTTATTLNFTGSGVTASGTGATKTINIPGGGSGGGMPTTGGTFTGDVTFTGDSYNMMWDKSTSDLKIFGIGQLQFLDSSSSSSSNMSIFHNNSTNRSYVSSSVGEFNISNYAVDQDILIRNDSGVGNGSVASYIVVSGSTGEVRLAHYANTKLTTKSAGVEVTGTLTASSNITAYSDERLKSDIKTIDNALDKVMNMRGVSYTKEEEKNIGVIAQEVEKVIPEVVTDGEYKSVAYGNMVGVLIEAIKEQQKQIDELKKLVG